MHNHDALGLHAAQLVEEGFVELSGILHLRGMAQIREGDKHRALDSHAPEAPTPDVWWMPASTFAWLPCDWACRTGTFARSQGSRNAMVSFRRCSAVSLDAIGDPQHADCPRQHRTGQVRDDTGAGLAVADYRLDGSTMTIYHSEVPFSLRGRGTGLAL